MGAQSFFFFLANLSGSIEFSAKFCSEEPLLEFFQKFIKSKYAAPALYDEKLTFSKISNIFMMQIHMFFQHACTKYNLQSKHRVYVTYTGLHVIVCMHMYVNDTIITYITPSFLFLNFLFKVQNPHMANVHTKHRCANMYKYILEKSENSQDIQKEKERQVPSSYLKILKYVTVPQLQLKR